MSNITQFIGDIKFNDGENDILVSELATVKEVNDALEELKTITNNKRAYDDLTYNAYEETPLRVEYFNYRIFVTPEDATIIRIEFTTDSGLSVNHVEDITRVKESPNTEFYVELDGCKLCYRYEDDAIAVICYIKGDAQRTLSDTRKAYKCVTTIKHLAIVEDIKDDSLVLKSELDALKDIVDELKQRITTLEAA